MSEGPIKLFSTRAERYPEPTEADVALGAGRLADRSLRSYRSFSLPPLRGGGTHG